MAHKEITLLGLGGFRAVRISPGDAALVSEGQDELSRRDLALSSCGIAAGTALFPDTMFLTTDTNGRSSVTWLLLTGARLGGGACLAPA